MAEKKAEPVIIKKYPNRRLYNTETSSYITLEDLRQMVKRGEDFVVFDAKTEENLTRFILTQIIFEQESKGYNILPEGFLKQLICFYDDTLSNVLTPYLEAAMMTFTRNQEQMRSYLKPPFETFNPMKTFEGLAKQNMQFFETAMKAFTEFKPPFAPGSQKPSNDKKD